MRSPGAEKFDLQVTSGDQLVALNPRGVSRPGSPHGPTLRNPCLEGMSWGSGPSAPGVVGGVGGLCLALYTKY